VLTATLIDGIAELLQLPVIYLWSHLSILMRGIPQAYQLERKSLRREKHVLSLRSLALINIMLIFILIKALESNGSLAERIAAGLRIVFNISAINDTQFFEFLGSFVLFYGLFYFLSRIFGRSSMLTYAFAAAALFYASTALLLYAIYVLLGLTIPTPSHTSYVILEYAVRLAIIGTYAYIFRQLGYALASHLRLRGHRRFRPFVAAAMGALCFSVYLIVLFLCLGYEAHDVIWPSISI
jgi:hypothetical protein